MYMKDPLAYVVMELRVTFGKVLHIYQTNNCKVKASLARISWNECISSIYQDKGEAPIPLASSIPVDFTSVSIEKRKINLLEKVIDDMNESSKINFVKYDKVSNPT